MSERPRHPPVRKRFGQHFLSDPRILARIADAAGLSASDTVVEIGPGRGALTEQLLTRAARVIAIEIDRALASTLRARYAADRRLTIVEGDVLETDLGALAGDDYVLVGNVPYYITTPILFRALERPRPRQAVFLVQREVAERIAAAPGSAEYGALSVNVQSLARSELLFRVAPGAFQPPPKVESAVIRLTPLDAPLVAPNEEAAFRSLVQAAFGMRRKQMKRVLRELWEVDAAQADEILKRAGIDPTARPEVLTPEEFVRLLRAK
ncbi:MAG TPA: 16S rRNA (adenine(1518)-N(6)/adenine(1519)-N(6))-dimethyltransferase RsmA [Gemmatimonadaceae bacterium]|nr:16S rRNA (adenine(1518)-N(6)/adenine(1519)-N(6))-dimethyltransferase RsmA [Gemmatimonadaceae bacterium]